MFTCLSSSNFTNLKRGLDSFPKEIENVIQYGTAGFRDNHALLKHINFRMGILAAIRSKVKKAAVGTMITASHNPEEDNGIKLIDPLGEMLDMSWEKHATLLANVKDEEFASTLDQFLITINAPLEEKSTVLIGYDTRSSSNLFAKAVRAGAEVLGANVIDYKHLTTPQLHYLVWKYNNHPSQEPSELDYYTNLSKGFLQYHKKISYGKTGRYNSFLNLDGANGVGADKMKLFIPYLKDSLSIQIFNDGSTGKLNHLCGADYVKVHQKEPTGLIFNAMERCVSFDGDADRIVYFYKDSEETFHLLDGDKIATLIAGYLKEIITASGLELDFCCVQTAYANGSSTNYIKNLLKIQVALAKTGVKHLHHRAQKSDVAVYFEANGHGTVLFSDSALSKIKQLSENNNTEDPKVIAAQELMAFLEILNQTVGDAISDMLIIETILHIRGWNIADWDAIYKDLPNRQLKVKVSDRNVITTTDAETKCVTPFGLQDEINELIAKYPNGRAFIRPSGTEDVVRIYAEASTQENADLLAKEVAQKVYQLAGGVGALP